MGAWDCNNEFPTMNVPVAEDRTCGKVASFGDRNGGTVFALKSG
jgi:hypothetical protein